MFITACYYHVTYAFQSESTVYSCLNIKELLAQNRRGISSLSDSNRIRTHNHLVHNETLNQLAKLDNNWAVLWVLALNIYLNGWVFVSKLIGCGFVSRFSIYAIVSNLAILAFLKISDQHLQGLMNRATVRV